MRIEKEYGKTPLEALKKAVWEIRCFRDTTQIIMNHFEGQGGYTGDEPWYVEE